jgi:hypothetical protein
MTMAEKKKEAAKKKRRKKETKSETVKREIKKTKHFLLKCIITHKSQHKLTDCHFTIRQLFGLRDLST